MIDHVLPKERITAEKTNQIIDKANGLQTPSARFVNTPNGTLTPPPDYTPGFSFFPVPEHILQTKRGPSLEMVYRGDTRAEDRYGDDQKMAWFCYLGPNTATLKSKASPYDNPDSIWLGSDSSQLFKEITDEMIASLSAVGNWVDVGAYDDKSVKVSIVKISKDEQSQQQLPEKYAVVICGGDLDSFDQLLEDNKYQMYDKTEEIGKHSFTIAAADNRDRVFQLGFGPDGGDDGADFPIVDSQVSALELSSLAEKTYTDATLSMDFTYRQLYNFDLAGTLSPSDLSNGGIEVVVRDSHTTGGDGARINYVDLSTITESLSGKYIPPDADVQEAQTSSLQTRELDNGTKVEEMFNFHVSDTIDIDLDNLSSYDIVVRNPNNGSPYVQYGKLSIDISGSSISGDHNVIPGYSNSIDTKKDSRGTYHQLYGFENPTTKNFYQLIEGKYQFVIRDYNSQDKYVVYSDISSFVNNLTISGDSNLYYPPSRTIAYKNEQGSRFYQLYNWNGTAADQSHVISAVFGETRYFPLQDGTGTASDLGNAAHILTRPRMGSTDLHYDAYGIKIPKVSPTDITQELYDLILSGGGGTDVSVIRRVVIDTLDDADAKQPLSSNLNDCFWPQGGDRSNCYGSSIGNSIKEQVIDLDGTKLKATGNNSSSLDWSSGICVDSEGEQSITWDGRGLIDSNGVWAIDWDGRQGYNSSNNVTIDWENSQLVGNWSTNGNLTVGGNGTLTIGNTTITEAQLQQLLALIT